MREAGAGSNLAPAQKGLRPAWFGERFVDTPVYDRYALRPGDRIEGPAIVEERESTTIVPPGDRLSVDDAMNLRIVLGEIAAPAPRVTADLPLREAMRRIEADPIGLEIMWSRLIPRVSLSSSSTATFPYPAGTRKIDSISPDAS